MRNTTRRTARAALVALTATCAMAFGASTASATSWNEIPAGQSAPAKITGTLTLNYGPVNPLNPAVTCPVNSDMFPGYSLATNSAYAFFRGWSRQTCSNGKQFEFKLDGHMSNGNTFRVSNGQYLGYDGPFSQTGFRWTPKPTLDIPVVNGSGAVKTKLVFTNADLDWLTAPDLQANGTLEISTPAGGTLTVSP